MATIIFIGVVAYCLFSGMLLIALLRSAARTSADWAAYTRLVNGQLTNAHPDVERAHMVAGTVPTRRMAAGQRATHHNPARPN